MSKSGAKRHVHKYRKLPSQIWACALPDCTHYMPTNLSGNMEGKFTLCWECGDVIIFDTKLLKMEKPVCSKCMLKLEGIKNADKIAEYIGTVERINALPKVDEQGNKIEYPKSAIEVIQKITGVDISKQDDKVDPLGD